MNDLTIPIRKFAYLLDYLNRVGVDVVQVATRAKLSVTQLEGLADETELPAAHYGRLYKAGIEEIQKLNQPIPWAAGAGTEAFELMCHCMIGAETLGDALALASRFEQLTYPLLSHNMRLLGDDEEAIISYKVNVEASAGLMPDGFERIAHGDTLARASGLKVWHALCGWLIGQTLDTNSVNIAAPYLNDSYYQSLRKLFDAEVFFDADENTMRFDAKMLARRIVHDSRSLEQFLENSIFQLLAVEQEPASTSAAIRSLIARDLPGSLPSFKTISGYLHMSESSLRRRLLSENTNYQQLKDDVRCQIATERLVRDTIKISDLSDYLSFTEPSSFIRSFKGWTGETPSAYREKMTGVFS